MSAASLPLTGGEIRVKVRAGELAESVRMLLFTLYMSVVVTTLVLFLLWNIVPHGRLIVWYVIHHLVTVWRALYIRAHRLRPPGPSTLRAWIRHYNLAAFATGLVWGAVGLFLLPEETDPLHGVMLVIMIGVSAVGLFTLAPLFSSYAALIIPLLFPTGVALLISGTTPGVWWGITLLVFMAVALSNGRRYNRNLGESLRLRYELERSAIHLEVARDEAEAASRAKSEFLAVMSHEVRTPVSGIIGMADLLMEREKDSKERMYLNGLLRSALNLRDIVNDILDLSKIEAGRMEVEAVDFDPRTLVSDTVVVYRELAAQKGLRLESRVASDIPHLLRGDPGRIRQVLHNLMANALKFTEEGWVRIQVTHMGRLDGKITIRFAVRDTGIGIPREKQEKVFESFTQADSTHSRRFGGTGLGLAISRQLTELMGGTLQLSSTPEKGSTFWFTVLLEEARPSPTTEPVGEDLGKVARMSGRVLVVDDNESNRLIVKEMLADRGIECLEARTGEEAILAVASAGELNMILMDCQMPLMDGYEATRHIRAWEETSGESGPYRLPIIAMTANASAEDRARCLETGMDDYLAKPFRISDLHQTLEEWLSPSREPDLQRA